MLVVEARIIEEDKPARPIFFKSVNSNLTPSQLLLSVANYIAMHNLQLGEGETLSLNIWRDEDVFCRHYLTRDTDREAFEFGMLYIVHGETVVRPDQEIDKVAELRRKRNRCVSPH